MLICALCCCLQAYREWTKESSLGLTADEIARRLKGD